MPVRVVEIDPAAASDERLARAALALGRRVLTDLEGDTAVLPSEESSRAVLADADREHAVLVAVEDGSVVAVARLQMPLREDRHFAWLQLGVQPGRRGRGLGAALFDAACARAAASGRTLLEWISTRPAGAVEGPDEAFARARGGRVVQHVVRSVADLPLPPSSRAAVVAEVAAHAGAYDVVTWGEAVPEPLLADRALLTTRMSTDQPLGERVVDEAVWDGGRWRAEEARLARRGRSVSAGAVERATGRLIAVTDVLLARDTPHLAAQGDTLVLREHRGHRLGLAVKLAVLDALARDHPGVRHAVTYNAVDNAPMLAVNAALGFRPSTASTVWNLDLTD